MKKTIYLGCDPGKEGFFTAFDGTNFTLNDEEFKSIKEIAINIKNETLIDTKRNETNETKSNFLFTLV